MVREPARDVKRRTEKSPGQVNLWAGGLVAIQADSAALLKTDYSQDRKAGKGRTLPAFCFIHLDP